MQDGIDIALGFDSTYAPHAAAAIASIVRHTSGAQLRFLVLHDGVSLPRRAAIETVAPCAQFTWIEVRDDDLPDYVKREQTNHVTRATLFRLGLEKLAPPGFARLLYLDVDITVLGDVRELWEVDLAQHPVAAVTDPGVDASAFAERWQLPKKNAGYFNAGVLLIDMQRIRTERIFSAAIDFLAQNDLELADQDALNRVLWGRWLPLDASWNMQRNMIIALIQGDAPLYVRRSASRPCLVHYTGSHKPWLPDAYHPWAWLYWEVLARTPFASEVARVHGVGAIQRVRLWLRWLRRRTVAFRTI